MSLRQDVRRSLNGLRKRLLSSPQQQPDIPPVGTGLPSLSRLESPDSGVAELTVGIYTGQVSACQVMMHFYQHTSNHRV